MGVGADVIGRSAPTPYEAVRGRVMSHPDATVKPSVGHIRLFGGMDVKGSNVVRVPPPTLALAVFGSLLLKKIQ